MPVRLGIVRESPASARHIISRTTRNAPRRRTFSVTAPCGTNPAAPPISGYALLSTRSIIHISGIDAPKFLHGLVTSSVHPSPPQSNPGGAAALPQGFYSAFLTAQGRIINDVFIYPASGSSWASLLGTGPSSGGEHVATALEDGFAIEVDAEEKKTLLSHLKRHKLRSKVKLESIEPEQLVVIAAWREGVERWTSYGLSGQGTGSIGEDGHAIGLMDQRAPGMGRRLLVSHATIGDTRVLDGLEEAALSQYHIRRYLRGVPEGQIEIPRDQAFPMNSNLDVMGAVDFKKGCYVGQELTIRTHHTGVVRRRVLPVSLYDAAQAPPEVLQYDQTFPNDSLHGMDIKVVGKRGKPGSIIGSIGNVGLAMCRLELMTDMVVTGEPSTFSEDDRFVLASDNGTTIGVKAFVPDWIRGRMRAPKVQKRVE